MNGPYVKRMIPEPCDTDRKVPVNPTFHEQSDDELTEKELKQIEADDQAIHTILLGLLEYIYATVDSCETAQEIWLRVQQLMKVFHPDLPSPSTFIQQPLPNNNYNPQPSFNQNYMKQPMPNLSDITDPTTAMNMELVLMAKAFKLNYSTPTNNNHIISLNPQNRQIAQPGMNLGQDNQMQMVGGSRGNQFRQYVGQNVRNRVIQNAVQNPDVQNVRNQNGVIVVLGIANQNGNGNIVAARAEGNANGNNSNHIRNPTIVEEFDLMAATGDLDEIEEVNVNCILMVNLQQSSTSGTQSNKAPVYDSDGSAEVKLQDNCYNDKIGNMFTQEEQYTELLEPISEPHQVQQNDSNVTFAVSSVEQAIEVEKVNSINRKLRETNAELTTELARYKNQEKCFEISQEKYDKLERMTLDIHSWSSSAYHEIHKVIKDEILPIVNQVDARVQNFETQFLKEATKFVGDFKSLTKEVDESIAKHKALELEIERLLRAVVSQDIMSIVLNNYVVDTSNIQTGLKSTKERFENCVIKKENEYAKLWNDWYKKCEECKYDKISYDKAYNDMQQKIERLQAQLGDQKGKCKDNPCVSDTLDPLPQKLENENVELEFQVPQKVNKTNNLANPVTSNSVPTTKESKFVDNEKVIAPGMFRIDPFKNTRKEKSMPSKLNKASVRTNSITVLQPHAITKKTKKIIETMNVTYDELSAMDFEQSSSKPRLQGMTSGQISLGLDLTHAPLTITTQKPNEHKLDLLFEAIYDDYIGGQPSATPRTITTTQAPQDVAELETQQQHAQQQENQALLQPETIADNVPNAMFDGNTFVNPFATPSTSTAESSLITLSFPSLIDHRKIIKKNIDDNEEELGREIKQKIKIFIN
nr:ribonuclease H-like domain-containing protein [Tanacetum cinerariifolium]